MNPDTAPPPSPAPDAAAPETAGQIFRRLGPAGPLAVASATLPAIGGIVLLGTLTPVGEWLRSHQQWGVVIYIVGFMLAAGLALLPTYAQAILGGWAFGFAVGFPAALVGFVGGSLLGYAVARLATGERVTRLVDEHPKWRAIYRALLSRGPVHTLFLATLLRLPPNSPFAATNFILAATRVPWHLYALGTLVGMAPRTALAVYLAAGMKSLDFSNPRQTWIYAASAVLTVIVVIYIGSVANRAIKRMQALPAE